MMHPDNEYLFRYMERLRSYAERYGMPFENDTALDFDWCLEMVDRAEQKGKADAIDEFSERLIKTLTPIEEGERMELEAVIFDIKLIAERLKENKNG